MPTAALAAALLWLSAAPCLAQAPSAIPALPDAERRTANSITAQTGPFNVNFALYGDGTDYANWLDVQLCVVGPPATCTVLTAVTDWTLASPTGPLATLARPITDAQVTLTAARTGTLQISGARRPRRTAQLAENRGVSAHDINQLYTDVIATERERWDRFLRTLAGPPGEVIAPLPPAAQRASGFLCWDATGLKPLACAGGLGTGNVNGPNVSVIGHIPVFANTTGTLISDGGLIGTGNVVGPASATNGVIALYADTTGLLLKNGVAGTTTTLLHGNAAGSPTYSAVDLTADVTGALPVANGGTGLTAGTSGGVPAYTASGVLTSSGTLASNQIVVGGGAGVVPNTLGTWGSATTVLHGAAGSGAPTFSAIALTADVTGLLPLANGGLNASLTASNGGLFYSTGSAGAVLAGTATANQIPLSGASAAPSWSTATYPGTTTINQLLYSSSANVITGLATANNGVLITSAGGVPSISSSLPAAVQGNITTVGTVTSGTWNGSLIPLANGGTNANLTASNGGIFYSTGSAGAILAGTATARQMLQSGASGAPAWSTATWPATTTANQILYSSATNTVAEITTANNGTLITSAGGVPSISSTLPSVVQGNITTLGTITSGTWNGTTVALANGGTGQTSASTARASSGLNIDEVTSVGNTNYTVLITDRTVATNANFTAQRTWTLPAVSAMNPGQVLVIIDSFGAINGANTLLINTNAGDTVNGLSTPAITLSAQYSGAVLWPIGSNKWGYIAATAGAGSGTVTSVATGAGLNGGTITTTGTLNIESTRPTGRLTLQSAVPVMVSSNTGQTTLYYAPYNGHLIPIYNGTQMQLYNYTASVSDGVGLSIALGSNWSANTVHDVYVGLNSSVVTLCTVAWTNTTTRATSLGLYNGVQTNLTSATCRSGNATTFTCAVNQCTFVGTVLTNASNAGQIDYTFGAAASGGTAGRLGVWNMYNRVSVPTIVRDSGASYTYTTGTTRQARASTGNQVVYVYGLNEDAVSCTYRERIATVAASGAFGQWGCGVDSTTVFYLGQSAFLSAPTANAFLGAGTASFSDYLGIGAHTLSANELGDGTNANTFNGGSDAGLTVNLRM